MPWLDGLLKGLGFRPRIDIPPPPKVFAPVTVTGPTDTQKALATDAMGGTTAPKTVGMAMSTQQEAVFQLRELARSGKLDKMMAGESKTGALKNVEAEKLFAALPTLTAATTAKDLLDLGLITQIPPGLDTMYASTPKYFVGRQVMVNVPVDTDHSSAEKYHTYKEVGEKQVTHRAYIVGESGPSFKVLVEGKTEPLLVQKSEIYRLNEGQQLAGKTGNPYGVKVDYANDALLKAKICSTIIKLDSLIMKMDFRVKDPELTKAALEKVPQPAEGTSAMSSAGKMVDISSSSQDGVGSLTSKVASPLRDLLKNLGQDNSKIGPAVQRILNSLVEADGTAKDLGKVDWSSLADQLQVAVKKDAVLEHQRAALTTVHGAIEMMHPRDGGADSFGTGYTGEDAGKLSNGGIGVCNRQASVLFAVLQPIKQVLGYDTQLEMSGCIKPRLGRDGKMQQTPPHGWVQVAMWPSGERFISDRTWHHPCLSLDYAFSPNGDRRHIAFDPKVSQSTTVTSKNIDMSGTFLGAKPVPVSDQATLGRPDH